jgi:hypothetical protein
MRVFYALQIIWGIACIGVLVICFLKLDSSSVELFLLMGMNVLTFPAGYVFALAFSAFGQIIETLIDVRLTSANRVFEMLIIWIGFVAVGYVQWFLLVPWAWRKTRNRLGRRRHSGAAPL